MKAAAVFLLLLALHTLSAQDSQDIGALVKGLAQTEDLSKQSRDALVALGLNAVPYLLNALENSNPGIIRYNSSYALVEYRAEGRRSVV